MILDAIVLNDYPGQHYATWVAECKKRIETRMMAFKGMPRQLVICCGNKSVTANKGLALCVVQFAQPRPMEKKDEELACIESIPGRYAYDLSEWKWFSRKFSFSKCKVSGSFQSIFQIKLPDDVRILNL